MLKDRRNSAKGLNYQPFFYCQMDVDNPRVYITRSKLVALNGQRYAFTATNTQGCDAFM